MSKIWGVKIRIKEIDDPLELRNKLNDFTNKYNAVLLIDG